NGDILDCDLLCCGCPVCRRIARRSESAPPGSWHSCPVWGDPGCRRGQLGGRMGQPDGPVAQKLVLGRRPRLGVSGDWPFLADAVGSRIAVLVLPGLAG